MNNKTKLIELVTKYKLNMRRYVDPMQCPANEDDLLSVVSDMVLELVNKIDMLQKKVALLEGNAKNTDCVGFYTDNMGNKRPVTTGGNNSGVPMLSQGNIGNWLQEKGGTNKQPTGISNERPDSITDLNQASDAEMRALRIAKKESTPIKFQTYGD